MRRSHPVVATLLLALALCLCSAVSPALAATNVSGIINTDTTWTTGNDPYLVSSVTIAAGATLTIRAGVEVQMRSTDTPGTGGVIMVNGMLITQGTTGSPVTFTGSTNSTQRGQWQDIRFMNGGCGVLDGCVIEYGGQAPNTAAVRVDACTRTNPVQMSDCTIRRSGTAGLQCNAVRSRGVTMENCRIMACATDPIRLLQGSSPHFSGDGNDFSGNNRDAIFAASWTGSNQDCIWIGAPVPYTWDGQYAVDQSSSLSIFPRANVAPTGWLYVTGRLTATNARFRSWLAAAGTGFRGIEVYGSGKCVLEGCSVLHADNGIYCPSPTGDVRARATTFRDCINGIAVVNCAQVTVRDCVFRDMSSDGMHISGSTCCPVVTGSEFLDCARYQVEVTGGASANFGNLANGSGKDDGNNWFHPTGAVVFGNQTSNKVRAQNNYWGYTTLKKILRCFTGKVAFKPYRIEPPVSSSPSPVAAATVAPISLNACANHLGGAVISYTLAAPGAVEVVLCNMAGRPVRRLCEGRECDAGLQALLWDGRSDNGVRVPGGVYLVTVRTRGSGGEEAGATAAVTLRR